MEHIHVIVYVSNGTKQSILDDKSFFCEVVSMLFLYIISLKTVFRFISGIPIDIAHFLSGNLILLRQDTQDTG